VDDLWATKSKDVGLIVHAISFQDFQPMWSWSTNVTDRPTDDMRSQDCALHYSASRGKNCVISILNAYYWDYGLHASRLGLVAGRASGL